MFLYSSIFASCFYFFDYQLPCLIRIFTDKTISLSDYIFSTYLRYFPSIVKGQTREIFLQSV
jgi:hypothetical protein